MASESVYEKTFGSMGEMMEEMERLAPFQGDPLTLIMKQKELAKDEFGSSQHHIAWSHGATDCELTIFPVADDGSVHCVVTLRPQVDCSGSS
jgi:hypothetical protein